jgi:hypothetical protein
LAALIKAEDEEFSEKGFRFGTTEKFMFFGNEYINAPLQKNTRYGLAILGYDHKNRVKAVSHFREIGVVIKNEESSASFGIIIGFACFAVFSVGGCMFFVAKYFEPLKYKLKNGGLTSKGLTSNSLGTNSNIGDIQGCDSSNIHDVSHTGLGLALPGVLNIPTQVGRLNTDLNSGLINGLSNSNLHKNRLNSLTSTEINANFRLPSFSNNSNTRKQTDTTNFPDTEFASEETRTTTSGSCDHNQTDTNDEERVARMPKPNLWLQQMILQSRLHYPEDN